MTPEFSEATPGSDTTARTSCPTGTCPRRWASPWATSHPSGVATANCFHDTRRGLSTLARQVYGYSLAFLLTGQDRYLTYAKAGIDWINTKAKDPVYGGYYGALDVGGEPINPRPTRPCSTWPPWVWHTACTST